MDNMLILDVFLMDDMVQLDWFRQEVNNLIMSSRQIPNCCVVVGLLIQYNHLLIICLVIYLFIR